MGTQTDVRETPARRDPPILDPWSQSTRLAKFVAVGLFGLVLIALGLAVDFILHALDPDLAEEEGLFTLRNPGHILLGLGIAGAAVGLAGAASHLIKEAGGGFRALRLGRVSLQVGLIILCGALAYIAAGPGFGHGHGEIADALNLTDGSRLSSAAAAEVDRSRLPPAEAAALASLAWSRSGNVEVGPGHKHEASEVDNNLTPREQQALDAQLAEAAAVVPLLDTLEEAEALGYMQASYRVDGVGAHWVKWSLVDRPFDPATPSMLLFEEVKYGEAPALVAFSYWVYSEDEPEGFAGGSDVWHQHYGLCFEGGWLMVEDIPDRSGCAGDWVNGSDLWMLHAWIVPGIESRYGVFSAVNPKLCERAC